MQKNGLVNTVLVPDHTFFSHTGMASSQLDYIFTINVTTEKHIQTKVNDLILCNTSSHVHLLMSLRASVAAVEKSTKTFHQKSVRFRWDRVIVEKFQSEITKELMKFPNLECLPVDRRLEITTEVLKTAAKNGVPSVITRLKGPSFKLSPSVKFHMKKRKGSLLQVERSWPTSKGPHSL